MSASDQQAADSNASTHEPGTVSGRTVVIGMFTFGIVATAIIWTYWEYHRAPFRHVEEAIIAEFPESAPRVEGGQRQMHKGTPRILRATLKVDFSPAADNAAAEAAAAKVAQVFADTEDLRWYDKLEINLYHLVPESEIEQWTKSIESADFPKPARPH
jgi:hypothetical protein